MKRNYDNEGNLISKECSCCHKIKSVSEFNKHKGKIDGLQLKCKECSKKYHKQYQKDNAEKIKESKKQYRKDNAEKINERSKQYYKDNAEKIKQYRKDNAEKIKEYYKDNAERIKERQKQYRKDNSESIKERHKKYRQDNAERIKEYQKQYRKDNSERIKERDKEYNKERNTKQVQEALQQIKTEVESDPEKYNYIEGKDIYGIIYLVHNISSNKYYIGQTTIGFNNRYPSGWLYQHSKKDSVKHDLELYGEDSFEYIKLFKVAHSQYELDKLEAYYIDYYNSFENGYNETRGNVFTNRGKEDIE